MEQVFKILSYCFWSDTAISEKVKYVEGLPLENICMKTNHLLWNEGLGDSHGVEVYLAPRMQVCFLVVIVA